MILTSYFFRQKIIERFAVPVSIALYNPNTYHGARYTKLNPTPDILMKYKDGKINDTEYVHLYVDQVLDHLNPHRVMTELFRFIPIGDERTTVCLLCYEPSKEFCHRHIVSAWFSNAGILCQEYKPRVD